jgi:hypothetical protein
MTLTGSPLLHGAAMIVASNTPHSQGQYEFRAFDVDISQIAAKLPAGSHRSEEETSHETYIVTRLNVDVGCKIRDGYLEVKQLLRRQGLLEFWQLLVSEPLPASGQIIANVAGPLLGVELQLSPSDQF